MGEQRSKETRCFNEEKTPIVISIIVSILVTIKARQVVLHHYNLLFVAIITLALGLDRHSLLIQVTVRI